MDSCDFELVKKIMASEEVIENGDGKIIVKAVPDGDGTGKMDKREFFIRSAIYAFQKSTPVKFSIEGMRMTTKTYCKDMCTKDIEEGSFDIDVKGRSVKVFSYVLADKKDETLPAMIYVHGGSFMASKAEYYKSPCRYVAENLGIRVFNVDYSLAPENVYPAAIEDVLAGLFYPCTDMYSQDKLYDWDLSMYDIDPEQAELITSRLQLGRADGKGNNDLMANILFAYSGGRYEEVRRNPDVSPIYADLSGMPYTGIFTAEYDGLRIQAEYYSRLLDKAGIPNKHIRYRGVSHAFLDYFGILPQAQAAVLEMCDQLRKVWGI